ncbi:MAG TPA: DcrB-related protein [Polyangiaceae bacterium]|jgi:hypothetical protein|nr:DcrB-related protein [Polyangiaceae bacterium]
MTPYHIDEGLLEVPGRWEDRSVQVFVEPQPETGHPTSIVVTREPLNVPLARYGEETLRTLSQTLPRFSLLEKKRCTLPPLSGLTLAFQWTREGVRVEQRQVIVDYYGKALTFTSTAPLEHAAQAKDTLQRFVDAVKFRKRMGSA